VPVVKISLSGILGFLSTGCKVIDASLFMISGRRGAANAADYFCVQQLRPLVPNIDLSNVVISRAGDGILQVR